MTTTTSTSAPVPTGDPDPSTATGRTATVALAVVLFASFMDLLDVTIVQVAAPAIAADLHASPAALQWTLAGYTLALGSGLIVGGRLGDTHGRRRVFLVALAAFAVASGLCALATSPATLVTTRVLQGLAGGLMVPQVFGIIRSSFAPERAAKAYGAYGAVQGLAAVAGPLLGGLLVEADLLGLGWRAIFLVNVPVAVLALVLGARVLPESSAQERAGLDVPGALLAAGAAVLVLLPLVQGAGWGWWGVAVLAAGVATYGAFVAYERRLAARGGRPVLDPALLRNRGLSAGLAVALLFFGAIGAFFLCLSLYLQDGTGRTPLETGLLYLPYAIGSIVTSGIGVALAARAGRALLLTGTLVLAGSQLALWWLVRADADPGTWPLAATLLAGGLGLGLTAPVLVNVVLAGVPGRVAGAASGLLSTVTQVGTAAGVAVLGAVFFATLGGRDDLSAYGRAFASVLPWEAAVYVTAALLMLLLPRRAKAG